MGSAERETFLAARDAEMCALEAYVAGLDQPGLLPLDLSYESVDRVDHLRSLAGRGLVKEPEGASLIRLVGTYLGEVMIHNAGGAWVIGIDAGLRERGWCIGRLRGLPRSFCYSPHQNLAHGGHKRGGSLRTEIESYDIGLLRASFARYLAEMDAEIETLRVDVRALRRRSLVPLDFSLDSLDRLSRAFPLLVELHPARERTLKRRCARYVGETLRRLSGEEWTLCEAPRNAYYGEPCVRTFAPHMNHLWSHDPPHLRARVEYFLEASTRPAPGDAKPGSGPARSMRARSR